MRRLFAAWIAIATALLAPGLWAQTLSFSEVLTVEGKVEVSLTNNPEWQPARPQLRLNFGDQLRTGRRSRATVRLADRSVVRVNELSLLQILEPKSNKRAFLDIKSGSIYFFSRQKPEEVQFQTPVVAGAIRGTEFSVDVAPNGETRVVLLDGQVALSNEAGEAVLNSGEQATAAKGQPPQKTAVVNALNNIQWCLYYPAVLDPNELTFSDAEKEAYGESLRAYRSGDLLRALAALPNKAPESDPARIYTAGSWISVGQVSQAEELLGARPDNSPLAGALRRMVAAVKHQPAPAETDAVQDSASWYLADSYYQQVQGKSLEALQRAQKATAVSPQFGFAWVRVAELEFSFGRREQALAALDKGLELSPNNAQAWAVHGFLLSAENKISAAVNSFDKAIGLDGGLGNAWLGRGLCRIRSGHAQAGLQDLQVAATVEPQRSVLRSYLGKAFAFVGEDKLAHKDLRLAKELDPKDPTPWLYSALLDQQENRINEAVRELEKSKQFNDNRQLYRSRFLLDQDRSVRSANLAAIYRDAGMEEVSVREASRAVNDDYANASAHLFLASSYDALRDPRGINLRYETPAMSELLVANLLAPIGFGNLSQSISQQEYSRMFAGDYFGFSSFTEYESRGAWKEYAGQYGTIKNTSYALDGFYYTDPGFRPNNDIDEWSISGQVKQQLTAQDSVYVQLQYFHSRSGDLAEYYDQNSANTDLRIKERQEPNVYAGYHREWSPGNHTLLLVSRLDDSFTLTDPTSPVLAVRTNRAGTGKRILTDSLTFDSDITAYSVELQQIWQREAHTVIGGARYQTASIENNWGLVQGTLNGFQQLPDTTSSGSLDSDLQRVSVYGYYTYRIFEPLQLTAGLSYDHLEYPRNADIPPLTPGEINTDRVSPKAGLLWTPFDRTHVRAAYTRSLGGVYFDNSIRLEPTQVGGFNQAYRSLIPESVEGLVPGTRFETAAVGVDHQTPWQQYLGAEGQYLHSTGERILGAFEFSGVPFNPGPLNLAGLTEQLEYKEKTVRASFNQLLGKGWSAGANYRLTQAELEVHNQNLPASFSGAYRQEKALLQQIDLNLIYSHRCGFFTQWSSIWSGQRNQGDSANLANTYFWQHNFYLGYRFPHRHAEIRLGLLNITDKDYRLNPITLYYELPRERTLEVSVKLEF